MPFKNSNVLIKSQTSLADKQVLDIAWVSRLDSDLFESLSAVVSLLDEYSKEYRNVKLHVIGDGAFLSELQTLKTDNLAIMTAGPIYGDDLYNYLYQNIDIGIGRGTVNLTFSSTGIPSVIIPLPTVENKNKKQFIFGNEKLDNYSEKYSLNNILNKIIKEYELFQKKSLKDVGNYDSEKIFPLIIEHAERSEFNITEIRQFVQSPSLLKKLKLRIKKLANA